MHGYKEQVAQGYKEQVVQGYKEQVVQGYKEQVVQGYKECHQCQSGHDSWHVDTWVQQGYK